jgi:iron complex outermembrane receptor protein
MKLKQLQLVVAMLFATQIMYAQFKISGTIQDKITTEKLTGANIYINDLKKGVIADEKGFFEINNLKKGTYFIEISHAGYSTLVQKIVLQQDIEQNFSLALSHKEIAEIVVTGVSRATEIKSNPIIIKSIDKNQLNQNSATNLIDALKNVPGISQITTGGAISKPVIRGLGYNRVISLVNGIKQEGQQWGDEHGLEIDEYSIDRIEIIKGPGSLMYGGDGISGVINFLAPKSIAEGKIKSQLITNYQTNNNLIGTSFSNAGNKNGIQWLGRLSHKISSNFQNKYDGRVLNSGFQELNGSLFLGVNKNWGHSHLTISTFNTRINLPEGERDSTGKFVYEADGIVQTATNQQLRSFNKGFPHQLIHHTRLVSNNYFILPKGTVNVDVGFQNNKRKEFASIDNPTEIDLFFDLKTLNYSARYNANTFKGWETSVGIGGMLQNNLNKGIEYLIPNYNLLDIGLFAHTQKALNEKLTIAGGLRVDNRSINTSKLILDTANNATNISDSTTTTKFEGFNKNYNGTSGSIGLAYQIGKNSTLKMNVSRGFRTPNIAEIASNGRHEGTFRYELGNKELKSEISHQIDLAYFLNNEHIEFELTPFANFINNYIFAKKITDSAGNDVIFDPSDPAPAFEFTQSNAKLFGGEIYIDFHPHPLDWLHIANSFSFVQATQNNQTDSTTYFPLIPAPKYRGELKGEFKKISSAYTNVYVKVSLDHFFKQDNIYSAYGTETATPSYTLFNVGFGGQIKMFGKKDACNLFVNIDNITNKSFQNHLSRLKYAPENLATGRSGIFNQGRNLSLKMIFNF